MLTPNTPQVLLLTDLVDSTVLTAALGDAAAGAWWQAHDRLARGLLQHWGGREIDKSDGFLLMFDGVGPALGFSRAYHRALRLLEPPACARAGLHLGPVITRHNSADDIARGAKPLEVEGLAKPAVARIMGLAQAGQTLLSSTARAALPPTAAQPVSYGHWRLKGLPEPVELFELVEPTSDIGPGLPPPDGPKGYRVVLQDGQWLPLQSLRHNLPAERDSFVGRQASLHALAAMFAQGHRLVSVLGIGGTGKTRLVQRFSRAWLGEFPGGAWFCDLAQARDLEGILQAVAQGLDVPLGKADALQQLGAAIHGRGPCLVILDNFEQVARHAEATLGQWLSRAAQACFLVTSREVLGIAGEQVLALPPLPAQEAAELFNLRAGAASSNYLPGAEDQDAIGPLVQLLDGLPLAIELAAARVRLMPPRMLLQRMGERFKLLASSGGRQDRQATLRAAIDWSWDLLSAAEQAALAQLSVFDGGFGLAAAEAVIDLSQQAAPGWATDALQGLVEKSLVRPLDAGRFDLLRSVQDYAAERLLQLGPQALSQAQARHWGYFASLDDQGAIADRCAELANLCTACRRSATAGDADAAVATLVLSWAALNLQGPLTQALPLVQPVQALPGLGLRHQALVHWVAGKARYRLGQGTAARASLEAGWSAAEQDGDEALCSRLLCALAELLARAGEPEAARQHLETALALARASGQPELMYLALNGWGIFCFEGGLLNEARQHYQAALKFARQLGHQRWIGGLEGNLGLAWHSLGREAEATACYAEALQLATACGDRQWAANAQCNLGLLHLEHGRHAAAQALLEEALAHARELGHARLESTVLCNLGLVNMALGKPAQAQRQFEAAAHLATGFGDQRLLAECQTHLAEALRAQPAHPNLASPTA